MTLSATVTVDRTTLLMRGVVALVLSLAVNWFILGLVLTLDLVAQLQALEVPPVTILTTAGVVGAVIVYALIDRLYRDPNPLFVRVAVVVLLLSFIPDLALLAFDEEATVGAVAVLMILHVPPALICIGSLTGKLFSLSDSN